MIPKIKKRYEEAVIEQQRPHPSGLLRVRGAIVGVYDGEYEGDVPGSVRSVWSQFPGELVYQVRLNTGPTMAFVSGDSPDFVFSVFGNAPLLIGRGVVVEYETGSIERGRAYIEGKRTAPPSKTSKKINVPDIGSII